MKKIVVHFYVGILWTVCLSSSVAAQTIDPAVQERYPAAVLIRIQAVLAKLQTLPVTTQDKLAQYYLKEDKILLETLQKQTSLTLTQASRKVQQKLQAEFDQLLTPTQRVAWYLDTEAKQNEWLETVKAYHLTDPDADSLNQILNQHYWECYM